MGPRVRYGLEIYEVPCVDVAAQGGRRVRSSVMNMVGTRSRAQEEVLSRLSTQLQASECLQSMNTLRAVVTATIVEIHKFGSVGVRAVTM
jgi:hypothetical protein